MIRTEPLSPERIAGWAELFEASHCPCYCRYWHFQGTKNDWLARCAFDRDASRQEHEAAVRAGADEALGLIAIAGDDVVGWMKLTPRQVLPKLTSLPVYRGRLSPDASDAGRVFAIGCLLVHPAHRGKGVARALIAAAPAFVRAHGGAAVEAYPRTAEARLHDEEAWLGPESVFAALGYERVAGEAPYFVYRLDLPA